MDKNLITPAIIDAIHQMAYCSQDGVPNDSKKVIAHYFMVRIEGNFLQVSNCHWFVFENDDFDTPSEEYVNNNGKVVFGAVDLGMGLELGSFSIDELSKVNVNGLTAVRDTSFEPLQTTMKQLRETYNLEWMV